jgi:hypothetical protein
MMSSPLLLEQYAACRQQDYQREAAAERFALQARHASAGVRARVSIWLVQLASWLASDVQPAVRGWELPDRRLCSNGVEYWPSA